MGPRSVEAHLENRLAFKWVLGSKMTILEIDLQDRTHERKEVGKYKSANLFDLRLSSVLEVQPLGHEFVQ